MELVCMLLVVSLLTVSGQSELQSELQSEPQSEPQSGTQSFEKKTKVLKPNIIIFLVDDLGYGDLTPYGHPTSTTPNIQQLANQGLLFTQFYSSGPVGSPSRAALLTGRYQTRSGVYPGVFQPDDVGGLPLNETTIAKSLKKLGYKTALLGKWQLGVGANGAYLPNHHGFDYYTGIPYSHSNCPCYTCFYPNNRCHKICDPEFVPCPVFECTRSRQRIVQQPADLTTLASYLLNKAVSFIQRNAAKSRPFFLLYSFHHTHGPQFSGQKFYNTSRRGPFGDSLREVDYAVGTVMKQLRKYELDSNTFVFFTSDNGPDLSFGHEGGSAGLLRCGKGSTWEGGFRVPAIARWKGKIRVKRRTAQLASHLDLFPTIMKMAGGPKIIDRQMDGRDMSPILLRNRGKSRRYWLPYIPEDANPFEGPHALRWNQYKAHYYTKGGHCSDDYYDSVCRYNATLEYHNPPLLFNLHTDPGEVFPLDTKEYSGVVRKMKQLRQYIISHLEWAPSQIQMGQNKTMQPCANPGCQPFPYCCKLLQSNTLSDLFYV